MNCTHETSIVEHDRTGFRVLSCTWECGQDLIELDLGNHTVKTFTAAELAALQQENEQLKAALLEAVKSIRDESECIKDNSGECSDFNVSLFTAAITLADIADKLESELK